MEENKYVIRTWYKKDEESLKMMEEDLVATLGKSTSFNLLMKKIETSQNKTLKVKKKMRIGINKGKSIVAAK